MNIFAGTEPPAWLTRMTEQKPGQLGHIIGELVGGLADSTEIAISKADDKTRQGIQTNWIKELPGSIKPGLAEARLNAQNPLWRMQAQQAQLNMAQQGLQMQNEQSLIDSRKTRLQMQAHDQQVLPEWLHSHPTWESRQDAQPPELFTTEGQRMFHDVQMGDAKSTQARAFTEGVSAYSKGVTELQKLDPMAAAPFAAQIGKVPTPQLTQALANATAQAQTKATTDKEPKAATMILGDGRELQGWRDAKGNFHEVKPKTEVVPKTLTYADGRTADGYMDDKGNFHELKAQKPPAEPKLNEVQRSKLDYARNQVETVYRELVKEKDQDRITELQGKWLAARKTLDKLQEEYTPKPAAATGKAQEGGAPTVPFAPGPNGAVRRYDPETRSLQPTNATPSGGSAGTSNSKAGSAASPAAAPSTTRTNSTGSADSSSATSSNPPGFYQQQLAAVAMKDSQGRTLEDVVRGIRGNSFTNDQEKALDDHPGFKALLNLFMSRWEKEQGSGN